MSRRFSQKKTHSTSLLAPALVLPLAACMFTVPATVHAQADRGSIAGTVTDASKASLPGARIEIVPAAATDQTTGAATKPNIVNGPQTTQTDQNGDFILTGLRPGRYTLKVSYLGFQSYTADVEVTPGKVTSAAPVLSLGNASEKVIVQAEREVGEAEALNVQRTALNIVQVLPSEVINSLPNVNIADAVGRLPSVSVERDEGEAKYIQIRGTEPRLNNVTIDGVELPSPESVRNVKLDTISAGLVGSLQLNKTLTSEMNGDGIGGSVNLVTRQATDTPYFAVQGVLGHTPLNGGRGMDQVFATYGQRVFNKKLGALISGSYDWNGRGINDIEPAQAVNTIVDGNGNATDQTVNAPNSIDIRDYYYDRSRYGLGGTLDYKFSEDSNMFLKGIYSYFDDYGEDTIKTLNVGNFTSPTTTDMSGSTQFSDNYRRPTQTIWNLLAGGQRKAGTNGVLSVGASLGQASFTGGSTYSSFDGVQNVGYTYSNPNPHLPHLNPVSTPGNISVDDASQYSLNNISFGDAHTYQRNAEGYADYSHGYAGASIFGTWQIGFRARDVIKNNFERNSRADAAGESALLSQFPSNRGRGNDYYFGQYNPGPSAQATSIISFYRGNPDRFSPLNFEEQRNLAAAYKVNERVFAGYAQNAFTYRRFRVYTGVRVEATNDDVRGYQPVSPDGTLGPANLSHDYTFVLPSASLQYNLGEYTDFRLAYSIGIARPDYGDLAPHLSYDPSASNNGHGDGANPALSAGNAKLKPTWSHNIDLLGEHYLKNVGVIQGGVFYKMLYDYIAAGTQLVNYTPPGETPGQYYEGAPLNLSAAHLIGFETSWEQRFTRLPGALGGTGFRANYSYVASVVGLAGRSDHPTLQRTAPNNYNFDVTYDKYNLSARVGINHNDGYLWQYAYQDGTPILGTPTNPTPGGLKGPQSDTYIYPHTQVDAQVSYLVPKGRGISVLAQFLNLNNEVFGFYNGSEKYPIQREYYAPTFSFGLRWTQRAEQGSVFHQ